MRQAYNPNTEELFHIAGDADQGVANTMRLTQTALARPQLRYKDLVIGTELYEMGGELALHIMCPRCHNALWIKASKKKMDWDPDNGVSVEPFQCTWELPEGRRQEFGIGLCRWRAAIDNNIVKDA